MEHPTGTDTKTAKPDRPSPPAPPPDNPGSPGQPSRTESRARSQDPVQQQPEAASAQPDGDQKTDAREPEAEDKPQTAGNTPAEQVEPTDNPASAKPQHTLPPDNPGSPAQPSRLESLARAREPVQQEDGAQKTEAKARAEDSGTAADDAVDVGVPADSGRTTGRPAEEEIDTSDSETELPVGQKEDPLARQNDHKPGTGELVVPRDEQEHPQAADIPDDFDRRIPGDGPADDDGRMAASGEVERGVSDRLKQFVAKLQLSDRPKELAGTVDRPDFQDPAGDPSLTPDRYGTPLDRVDGTRIPLFKGEPTREQTEQGVLGDCGVIATLGAVAAHSPEAIRDCVRETDDGNYEVRLHEAKYSPSRQCYVPTGRAITLTVTPEFPIKDQKPDTPSFARTTSAGVAWSPVLEKAIAGTDQSWGAQSRARATELWNIQGRTGEAPTGYVRLNQGTNPGQRAELLTQLTGRPAKTVRFPSGYDNQGRSEDRRLHDEIAGQLSQNKPILVGTRELNKGESDLPKRLIPNHAYEVTRVDREGKFHLRNPWNYEHPEPMTIQEFKNNIRPRYTTLD